MAYAPPAPPRRPVGVAILAILVIIAGVILTILTLLAVLGSARLLALGVPGAGFLLAISGVALILSLLLLASGIGLWNLRRWAWFLAVLATGIGFLFQLSGWYAANFEMTAANLLRVGLPFLILIYLFAVSKYFGRQPSYAYR